MVKVRRSNLVRKSRKAWKLDFWYLFWERSKKRLDGVKRMLAFPCLLDLLDFFRGLLSCKDDEPLKSRPVKRRTWNTFARI